MAVPKATIVGRKASEFSLLCKSLSEHDSTAPKAGRIEMLDHAKEAWKKRAITYAQLGRVEKLVVAGKRVPDDLRALIGTVVLPDG